MQYLYETHMHTSESSACAVSTAAEQVRAYKGKGYTGIIVTDHFINGNSTVPWKLGWNDKMKLFISGYEAALSEGEKCGLDVFFGLEFTIRGSDFLTYGLKPEVLFSHPGMDGLSAEEYSALVRRNGGYLAQAHPYRNSWYIEYKFPVAPELLDGVEVYNASMPDATNAKARAFAKQHDLPPQAGSDSHSSEYQALSGVKLNKKADDIFGIIDAIKQRQAELIQPKF